MKHFGEFARYTSLHVLGMVGLSCYILADTFFVARGLGTQGLAALNLAIPIYSLIHGSGLMLGVGGATRYSLLKGRGEAERASQVYVHALLAAAVLGAALLAVGIFLPERIALALGADEAVFSMSKTYLQVLLLFAPLFLLNNVLLCFVRNDGAPQRAMLGMLGGSLSNIALDYLFIFPLGMGIFGAVLATGLAPAISMLLLAPHFARKKQGFHIVKPRLSRRLLGDILSSGLPSLIAETSAGIVMIVFNTLILGLGGNVGVAAYGVIANLSLVVIAVYNGIAQGAQPLISRAQGLGDAAKARRILRYALGTMALISMGIYGGVFLGAERIADIFNNEQNALLQAIAVPGLRIYFTACLFCGFNIVLSAYFTATEQERPAHVLSLLRGFLLMIPLTLLLSALGGMTGIWCAFPLTELLSSAAGALFLRDITKQGGPAKAVSA